MATLNLTLKNSSQATILTGTVTYDVTVTAKQYVYYFRSVSIKNASSSRQDFRYVVRAGSSIFESDTSPSLAAGGTLTSTSGAARNSIAVDRGATATNGLYFMIQSFTSGVSGSSYHTVQPRESWTVTFDANGGTGGPTTQSKANGTALTLTTSKPTRSGHAFAEWNTAANHGGTAYQPGGSYSTDADVTLYAIWNPVITYYPNGGSGSAQTQQKPVRTAATIKSASTFTRSGYAFDSWNTAAGGSGTRYAAGASYSTNAPLTLYAQWLKEPNPPTISALSVVRVDANGDPDDEGLFAKVTVTWSVDLTSQTVGNANRGTLRGAYVASSDTSQATSLTWTGTWQNATGSTATATFPASLDEQYLVLVTVTDARNTSSKADVLTRAQFVMDFRKGGKAIGIGSAAPQDGLLIGWDTEIIGDIAGGGKMSLRNPSTNRDNPGSSDVWDTQHCLVFCDADGERTGLVRCFQLADGRVGITLIAVNEKTDGTEVYNALNIYAARDGTQTYTLTNPTAFRSTLGLARVTQIITASSGVASGGVRLIANSVMATVNINGLKLSASLANNSSIVIGTVPSGYRPYVAVFAATVPTSTAIGNLPLKIWINAEGAVTLQNFTGAAISTSQVIEGTLTYAL